MTLEQALARIAELEAENFTLKQNEFSLPVNAKINRKQKAMKDLSRRQAND